jgi:hypothetical protein
MFQEAHDHVGKTLLSSSGRILFALSLLLVLPSIAVVAAPPAGLTIGAPSLSPSSPGPNDQVTVNVTVTAGTIGVKNVTLHYTTDGWKNTNTTVIASYNATTQRAIAHIPPQYYGGTVEYYIVAFDNNNNQATRPNTGNYFSYTVAAPVNTTTSMWIEIAVVIIAVGAAVAIGFYSFRPKAGKNQPTD